MLNNEAAQRELRRVFGQFATGVTVITGRQADETPVGVTANSVTSVSLDPPLLLWCLANKSRNIEAFSPGRRFAVHVLAQGQTNVALHFARSGGGKFDGHLQSGENTGPPLIAGFLTRMVCRVASHSVAGDHTIILGEVESLAAEQAEPLVFQGGRFGRFLPGQADSEVEPWRLFVEMWS